MARSKQPGRAVATCGRKGAAPRIQLQADRHDRWTASKERAFLTALAVTCNVRHSLRQVGMSAASLYYRRRTNPAFQAAWDHALNEGYASLEADMLARAIDCPLPDGDTAGAVQRVPMSDAVRMALLSAHARRVGQYRATQGAMQPIDTARLKREITLRLDRLAISLGLEVRR